MVITVLLNVTHKLLNVTVCGLYFLQLHLVCFFLNLLITMKSPGCASSCLLQVLYGDGMCFMMYVGYFSKIAI